MEIVAKDKTWWLAVGEEGEEGECEGDEEEKVTEKKTRGCNVNCDGHPYSLREMTYDISRDDSR